MAYKNTLKIGLYLRLSRDDDDFKDESQSISNQREYITSYIRKFDNFIIIDEYIDDGYTGSNFERPSFKRLINDIKQKKINCIIVKDQSRFGRNDLVPYYIKAFFPLNKVRFIAINSQIDTFNENATGNKLIGLNSYVDTKYCEDISDKVKSTIYTKKIDGKHLGGHALYGYKKDPNNKYKIIIDEEVAGVVRKIFEMFANGNSLQMICRTLDNNNILIPSEYKKLNRGNKSSAYGHWNTRTIDEMLKNEMYIGNMCQCRTKRPAVSIKTQVRNPKDKWIIVPNTHEPIIDTETFNIVQQIYKKNSHITKNTKKYLLKGFIKCKECGHTIGINTSNKKGYCICNYYRKYSKLKLCTPHSISYNKLESIILKEIKKVIRKANKKLITDTLKKNDRILIKIKNLEKENIRLQNIIDGSIDKETIAYMDKLNGRITIETYNSVHNKIINENIEYKKKLKENKKLISNLIEKNKNKNYEKIINEYISLKKPSRKILASLIDTIILDEKLNIEIIYKIKTPI